MNLSAPPPDETTWPIKIRLAPDATAVDAWQVHRLFHAHDGHAERAGLSVADAIRAEELLVAPGATMADIEAKCRALVHELMFNAEPLAAASALGPIGHPVDAGLVHDDFNDRLALSLLTDIVRLGQGVAQPPARSHDTTWDALRADYEQARAEELKFDAAQGLAGLENLEPQSARSAACDAIAQEIWDVSGRLANARGDTEDLLMAHPCPDAGAFALKYLIAFGDDRGADGWCDLLEAEARRFVGPPASERSVWDAAHAEYTALKERYQTMPASDPEWDAAEKAHTDAEDRLMDTPAPDMAAWEIRKKLMIQYADPGDLEVLRVEHVDALIADLRRLA